MRCPFCGLSDSRVLDSRPTVEGHSIRRRRECGGCGKRFTTYEKVDELPLVVVKKDGRRETFDRRKLLQGLIKACQKRPVSIGKLEAVVESIEKDLRNTMEPETKSSYIGELVMDSLRSIDEVAYVRFASVYREFRDAESFMEELKNLLKKDGNSLKGGPGNYV
ncbi:MAG: Transcriptional repressor NrdR [Pelotomaculum sp. PtaU1.Bin035]|nr:MAG: Transcriptional repressor NrdR [Pelotomaculum sp. PtaU1.Bin035]